MWNKWRRKLVLRNRELGGVEKQIASPHHTLMVLGFQAKENKELREPVSMEKNNKAAKNQEFT